MQTNLGHIGTYYTVMDPFELFWTILDYLQGVPSFLPPPYFPICQIPEEKIPHTGDKASLDRCG